MEEIKKFYLYMDETGAFERKNEQLKIRGLLVPENQVNLLKKQLSELFGDTTSFNSIHATNFYKNKTEEKNIDFIRNLIKIIKNYNLILFSIDYKEDLNLDAPFKEIDLANRHLLIVNTLFEYIVFLNPELWGHDIGFSFYPNSRTLPIETEYNLEKWQKAGFWVRQKLQNKKKLIKNEAEQTITKNILQDKPDTIIAQNKSNPILVHYFHSEYVRSTLLNLSTFFSYHINKIGKREFDEIKTLTSETANNYISYLTDHLVYLSMKRYNFMSDNEKWNNILSEIESLINIKLDYSHDYKKLKQAILSYIDGDISAFYQTALTLLPSTKNEYYKKVLKNLINKSQSYLKEIKNLYEIESAIDYYISNSYGNWEDINDILNGIISFLEVNKKTDNDINLLKKFYNHKIRIANHRGDIYAVMHYHREMEKFTPLSIDEFLEKIDTKNRLGVAVCNILDFQYAIDGLTPYYNYLILRKEISDKFSKKELSDDLLCRVCGTLGQSHAFLALKDNSNFNIAEEYFLKAKNYFPNDEKNLLRHDINLFHLYMDWHKADNNYRATVDEYFNKIINREKINEFLNNPSQKTSRYMQFVFHCIIKYFNAFLDKESFKQIIDNYSINNIKNWFGDASNEHPFQFIYMYLGMISMDIKNFDLAKIYFEESLTIPKKSKGNLKEPIFIALNALIYAVWAKKSFENNLPDYHNNISNAIDMLNEIGKNKELSAMLMLDDNSNAVGGWFMEAYNGFKKIDWKKDFDMKTTDNLINCFTFNYY